jgi:type II secretory pathway pseudopilin PulG
MRNVDKLLAKEQAKLDRAKLRGFRPEINRAALAVGRAVQAVQRQNQRELEEQAEKERQQAERAEKLANPSTPAERRSAAAVKGWQTRRENELKRQRGEVQDQLPKQRAKRSAVELFAVDDDGGMWPTRRSQLTADEQRCADAILAAFPAGAQVFKAYIVAAEGEPVRFYYGAVVYIEDGQLKWGFTQRALDYNEALVNTEALAQTNSGGQGRVQVCAIIPVA